MALNEQIMQFRYEKLVLIFTRRAISNCSSEFYFVTFIPNDTTNLEVVMSHGITSNKPNWHVVPLEVSVTDKPFKERFRKIFFLSSLKTNVTSMDFRNSVQNALLPSWG